MFNEKLFFELCEKHGVELSSTYKKPMIKIDNSIREVSEEDIKSLVPAFQHYFYYDGSNITSKHNDTKSYPPNELLIAC